MNSTAAIRSAVTTSSTLLSTSATKSRPLLSSGTPSNSSCDTNMDDHGNKITTPTTTNSTTIATLSSNKTTSTSTVPLEHPTPPQSARPVVLSSPRALFQQKGEDHNMMMNRQQQQQPPPQQQQQRQLRSTYQNQNSRSSLSCSPPCLSGPHGGVTIPPVSTTTRTRTLTSRTTTLSTATVTTTPPHRYIPALAFSASTPGWAKVLIPILAIVGHAIFYYGQTEPMWKLHVNATIDVWANATSTTTRTFFYGAGIPYENQFYMDHQQDVQTFTYYFAIHELWSAKNLPGLVIPRLAAILLIVFSGIWPHLKLVMLNITWFVGKHPIRRTRALQWLSGLGKWSLADVLVVCVMVGVLHLDWVVEPEEIKQGLMTDLPSLVEIVTNLYSVDELCNTLLKKNCASPSTKTMKAKCALCSMTIGEAYAHPEWAGSMGKTIIDGIDTNGGGLATLRVVGMRGIYAFCGAVILSIVLSLIVDIFDVQAKRAAKQSEEDIMSTRLGLRNGERAIRRLQSETNKRSSSRRTHIGPSDMFEEGLETPLLTVSDASVISITNSLEIEVGRGGGGGGGDQEDDANSSLYSHPSSTKLFSFQFLIVSFITALIVFLAVDMFTMERLVYGAGPKLLSDILSVNFEKTYSMRSLMWTTGAAGGWDNMIMATFGLFCVMGPFVRGILLAIMVLLDQFQIPVSGLAMVVSFLGSFCSWEVFAIAIVMVQMLMPTITNTIIQHPLCGQISEDGSCLTVEFNIIPYAFSTLVIGGLLLVGLSWTASGRAMKQGEESVTPGGAGNRRRGLSTYIPPVTTAPNHHDYQRLSNGRERTQHNPFDEDLEELVFETNQV